MSPKPKDYQYDAGLALTFDTLCDRGYDPLKVAKALDDYGGDMWCDIFGPAIDAAAEAIGLAPYPEED